jgi:hypothetical protein
MSFLTCEMSLPEGSSSRYPSPAALTRQHSSLSDFFSSSADPPVDHALSGPEPLPACLITLPGPTKRDSVVKFPSPNDYPSTEEFMHARDTFQEWWNETKWGKKQDDLLKKMKMKWGGEKRSSAWNHFDEVATQSLGEPKVRCKHCYTLLHHPSSEHTGTTTMRSHPSSQKCSFKGPGLSTTSKRTITAYLAKATVCFH